MTPMKDIKSHFHGTEEASILSSEYLLDRTDIGHCINEGDVEQDQ